MTRGASIVFDLLDNASSREVAALARPYFEQFVESVCRIGVPVPSPVALEDDEADLSLEWIFPTCRMGLMFCADPTQSGWYFVSRIDAGGEQACGDLSNIDVGALVQRTARKAGIAS